MTKTTTKSQRPAALATFEALPVNDRVPLKVARTMTTAQLRRLPSADQAAIGAQYLEFVAKRQWALLTAPQHQAKMEKALGYGYAAAILQLAPRTNAGIKDDSGKPVSFCDMLASKDCIVACIANQGRNQFDPAQRAQIFRSWAYHYHREQFLALLRRDLATLKRWAAKRNLTPAARLDGTSGVGWAEFAATTDVTLYDYSEKAGRVMQSLTDPSWPANYKLCYSFKGTESSRTNAKLILAAGGTVAAVFDRPHRDGDTWEGFPSVDGDMHDVRAIDPAGHVVWLKAKETGVKVTSGLKQAV
jgi:hypothetical protein